MSYQETENHTPGLRVSRNLAAGVSIGTTGFTRKQQAKKNQQRPKFFSVTSALLLARSKSGTPTPSPVIPRSRFIPSDVGVATGLQDRADWMLSWSACGRESGDVIPARWTGGD